MKPREPIEELESGQLEPAKLEPAQLVPHSGEIVLLDTIDETREDFLQAQTAVRNDGLFNVNDEQVPVFIAVEYMAQAIAAWAGYHGRKQGQPVQPGLLLGSRDFNANVAYLTVGDTVTVAVTRVMETNNGLAVFDGTVRSAQVNVSARLSVLTVDSLENINNG